ncbi:hypothetical protein ACNO5M_27200 [Vibrio owensii]|uniref:hypothetical protein n=1 Tax=Vibrio owensii TaxID=696485 RepID=UPI003AB073FF
MSTTYLTKHVIPLLILLLSVSGWITSAFLYQEISAQHDYMADAKLWNAENILKDAFREAQAKPDIIALLDDWKQRGATAQTGSITTVCDNQPENLAKISPALNESTIATACQSFHQQ